MYDVCYSIAMATKENMQSQRGALYAITHRMHFLASILCLFAVCHRICARLIGIVSVVYIPVLYLCSFQVVMLMYLTVLIDSVAAGQMSQMVVYNSKFNFIKPKEKARWMPFVQPIAVTFDEVSSMCHHHILSALLCPDCRECGMSIVFARPSVCLSFRRIHSE